MSTRKELRNYTIQPNKRMSAATMKLISYQTLDEYQPTNIIDILKKRRHTTYIGG